jgi:hypothetical protein
MNSFIVKEETEILNFLKLLVYISMGTKLYLDRCVRNNEGAQQGSIKQRILHQDNLQTNYVPYLQTSD